MTVQITGANFIGYRISAAGTGTFNAFDPVQNTSLPGDFHYATDAEMEQALQLAQRGFEAYQKMGANDRAVFLEAIAEEIMALGDTLIDRCTAETALLQHALWGTGTYLCTVAAVCAVVTRWLVCRRKNRQGTARKKTNAQS